MMKFGRNVIECVGRWRDNIRGSFAATTAVAMMMIVTLAGVAYDYNSMISVKSKLQDSVDLAALAGASIARTNETEMENLAIKTLEENVELIDNLSLEGMPSININNSAKEITVTASSKYETLFGSLFALDSINISATSTSGYGIEQLDSFAIYLVLDISSSMTRLSSDGTVKLNAVKTAVDDMFYTLYSTSDDPIRLVSTIRTGFSTYSAMLGPTRDLNTGYATTVSQVNALVAGNGTNSTPGLQYAYDQIADEMDNVSDLTAYIVFMTDGDNNNSAFDVSTITLCEQAKADNITIFTVAFEAPEKGQELLQACATSPDKAYTSRNAGTLNAAFRDIASVINKPVVRLKR